MFSIRPLPEDEMQAFAQQLPSRFEDWRDTPFNDPSEVIDGVTESTSCMGLVVC